MSRAASADAAEPEPYDPLLTNRLFGHSEAEAFLAETYRSGQSHHAILIEGPEGIGKATLAFRFANHVLSFPDPQSAPAMLSDPDPASPVTRQIVAGASHNLLHLVRPVDPKTGRRKSEITVEEARRALKFFQQTSGNGNWRIIIIDPADDLNRNAANAILKLLEEPPRQAMFLVLAHAPGRLLPTIRSRCMAVKLRPLALPDLGHALEHLGLGVSGEQGQRILAEAQGSVSEAILLMENGGLDIIDAFEAAIAASGSGTRAVHRLADVISARGGDGLFDFFARMIGRRVTDAAAAAARAGNLDRADALARLAVTFQERLTIGDAYNLDRKQTVLSIVEDLRGALSA